jgi:hypothetical protein
VLNKVGVFIFSSYRSEKLIGMISTARAPRRYREVLAIAILTVGCCALAGCQGAQTAEPDGVAAVASIAGSGSGASDRPAAQGAADENKRPLIRADTSQAEQDRYREAWSKCLLKHGIPTEKEAALAIHVAGSADTQKYPAAMKACILHQPEDYKDRIQRTDKAHYEDLARQEQKCIRSAGIKISHDPKDDAGVFSFTDEQQVGEGMQVAERCEKETFGRSK